MPQQVPFEFRTIHEGLAPADYLSREGEFLSSLAIDPDLPIDDSSKRPSGLIRPGALAKFSGANVNTVPLWIITNPKDTYVRAYLNNGRVVRYDNDLSNETLQTTITSSGGNGGEYYDNKILLAKNADIAAITDIGGTPAVDQTYWTSTLGLTALTDTTYPSINGVEMPNHVIRRNLNDDEAYICDVNSDGKGILNAIKTTKTTVEGDTDNGSAYQALDFDYGFYPTCVEPLNATHMVIGLIEGVDTTAKQKPFSIALWDTSTSSFESITHNFPDPLVTALKNHNGTMLVFSGSAAGGCRVSVLLSNYTLQELFYIPDSYPPLAGAVDDFMTRIAFGGSCTDPATAGCVWAIGSRQERLPMGLHNILRITGSGSNPYVTAFKYVEQNANVGLKPIVGWKDDSAAYGIDKVSTTYQNSIIRFEKVPVNQHFQLKWLRIPLAQTIGTNKTVVVTVYYDDAATSESWTFDTSSAFNGERYIRIENFSKSGRNNFYVQVSLTGTALLVPGLPVRGVFDLLED